MRSIPLSDYVRAAGSFRGNVRVTALAFSPDERWLAATVNEGRSERMLVLSVEPRAHALRYSARLGLVHVQSGEFGRIAWSPDGKAVVVGTKPPVLIDLERETSCQMHASRTAEVLLGGFSSPSDIAVAEMSQGKWRLVMYNLDCKAVHYRDLDAPVTSVAASDRGRVALSATDGRVSLYDAVEGTLVKEWGRPMRRQIGFVANGELVCEAGHPARERSQPECWSASDDTMSRPPNVVGGAPFSAAAHRAVAAFTDGKYSYDAFFETGKQGVRRGVIWSFTSGKAIASWKPEQEACAGGRDVWSDCRKPTAFALAPEGNYFVETKSGHLRIYRVIE